MEDRHIYYPHELAHDDVILRIFKIFGRTPNADVLLDPKLDLPNFIWRVSYEYDLNPAWVMVTLQRERGLLHRKAATASDWDYCCGYVGQDGPGTKNPRWNGLVTQLWLCIHQSAWLAGNGNADAYGVRENLHPKATRWLAAAPRPVQLYSAVNVLGDKYTPKTVAEHLILSYTPHMEALQLAQSILEQSVPEFF